MNYTHLFQPIKLGRKLAQNRIEIAPAAPFLAGHDGSLSQEFYAYNRSLASYGAGIVTLGVTDVDPARGLGSRTMCIGSDLHLSDFNELAELFHMYGSLASCEMVFSRYMRSTPDAVVNQTSTADVEHIIESFANAAERLVKCGFDIAFVHGGHGNVPAMFFRELNNHRTDRFGGSFEGRCQFAVELLEAIRARVGDKLAITYRISAEEMLPGHTTFEETLAFAKVIEPYIDLLHVSRGLLDVDELVHYINAPLYLPRAMNLPYAARFKEELAVPVTVVGSFDLATADAAIAAGDVDMVSMIRNVYADTQGLAKARAGQADDIRPCVRCNTCIDRTHSHLLPVRCAVNPTLGRESLIASWDAARQFDPPFENQPANPPADAQTKRTVAVIGGGPAGMQAAQSLVLRGFDVTLFEKSDKLGGLLNIAGADPGKPEIAAYARWLANYTLGNPHVDVHLACEATPEIVAATNPWAVFLATGSNPIVPAFAADSPLPCQWVGAVDLGEDVPGEHVLIAGAGMTGLECALSLVRKGKRVTLADPQPFEQLGAGASLINVRCLKELLLKAGVQFACEAFVEAVTSDGVLARPAHPADGESDSLQLLPCDSVVYSLGFRAPEATLQEFEAAFERCYRIGDCAGVPANIFHATQTAFDAAWRL